VAALPLFHSKSVDTFMRPQLASEHRRRRPLLDVSRRSQPAAEAKRLTRSLKAAVGVGSVIQGEAISLNGVVGMFLMLLAAGGCLFADQITIVMARRSNRIGPRLAEGAKKSFEP
jgi:hypothetical protein